MWPFKGSKKQSRLIFLSPSKNLQTSLPVGCGNDGAFILGGVGEERVKIFHLFDEEYGECLNGLDMLDTEKSLCSIKRELGMGNVSVAETVMSKSFENAGYKPCSVMRTFSVEISMDFHRKYPAQDYRRVLDLLSGLETISFVDKTGTTFRDSFISNEGIFCYRYYGPRLSVCDISFLKENDGRIVTRGDCIVWLYEKADKYFGYGLRLISDGSIKSINGKMCVKDASILYVFGKAFEGQESLESAVEEVISCISKKHINFDVMFKASSGKLFKYMSAGRVTFSKKEVGNIDSEMLRQKSSLISVEMIDCLYNYGKYLSYALSSLSLNMDSFFCDKNDEDISNDECAMNYLKFARIILPEIKRGEMYKNIIFFDKFHEKIEIFVENAKKMYDVQGIFVPVKMDKLGYPAQFDKYNLLNKNMTYLVGMLAIEMMPYCERNVKEKLQDITRGVADFYEQFLKFSERVKVLYSPFGISPLSVLSDKGEMMSDCCRTDLECARHIFTEMARLSEENEQREHYLNLASQIPDVMVDSAGCIKEFDSPQKNLPQSKYLSHLVPYSLGLRCSNRGRDYEDLVSISVKNRYINSFGNLNSRDLIDMALTLSATSNGVDCMEVISLLLRTFLMGNLIFSGCDNSNMAVGKYSVGDFVNIDANTALTLCLQNILVSYSDGTIFLSRDYPKYFYCAEGRGLILDKDLVCSIIVNGKRGIIRLKLMSSQDRVVSIMLPMSYRRHKGIKKKVDRVDMSIRNILLVKNKVLKLVIYF